jgi:hypothetical protein
MHHLVVSLALAAFPGLAQQPQPADVAPIAIYTQFQHDAPEAVRDAVRDAVEEIMSPSGLEFQWRELQQSGGNQVSVELAVVSFKGQCHTSGPQPAHSGSGALGWTHMSDGVILPFADVDCDRIHNFLHRDLAAIPADSRDEVFGRAVGRVLAHELYHIFANTAKHQSCGVGKSAYTVQELLSEDFRFEGHEPDALRANRPRPATMTESAGPAN